jgi:hypothetical protein
MLEGVLRYMPQCCYVVYKYNCVGCGPLVRAACRLVIQGICFKEADLSVAPTKCMQLRGHYRMQSMKLIKFVLQLHSI